MDGASNLVENMHKVVNFHWRLAEKVIPTSLSSLEESTTRLMAGGEGGGGVM